MNTTFEYLTGEVFRRLGLTKRDVRHAEGRVQRDQPVEVYQHPQQERIARFANPPQHRSFRFDADHKRNRQKDRNAVEWDRLQTVLRIKLGRSDATGHEPVRSDERRGGNESVSTDKYRWSAEH